MEKIIGIIGEQPIEKWTRHDGKNIWDIEIPIDGDTKITATLTERSSGIELLYSGAVNDWGVKKFTEKDKGFVEVSKIFSNLVAHNPKK